MSKWIYKLEYRFRRFGVDNLMIYLTGTMLAVYFAENLTRLPISGFLFFNRDLILQGQVWRLVTFLFLPPRNGMILWVLLALYFYYFIGNSLESVWGKTRFTMYYLCGALGAILAGFITGYGENMYLNLSMFLAFAALFPNHEIMLFFVLPVKVKYLAYLDAALLLLAFLTGGWAVKAAIVASLINLLLFFGDNFINWLKDWKRYGKNRLNFRRNARQNRDYWR